MAKTLYLSDLDGTLLGNDSLVSEKSAEIITGLTTDGAMISVATARTPATVDGLLSYTPTNAPAIVMTGASMWDRDTKRYINPRLMPDGLACDIIQVLTGEGVNPFVYCLDVDAEFIDVYHSMDMNPKEREFYETRRNLSLKRFHIGIDPDCSRQSVILVFATGPKEEISRAGRRLSESVKCAVSVYPDIFDPKSAMIEIFTEGVSKSQAAIELKKMTGADRLVVFGDNLNDIPMMKVADLSVAVENAYSEVKAAASVVIGRNSEDSVARFILKDYYNL